jgi:hypothetical protein
MQNSVAVQTFLQLSPNMVTTSELRQYVIAAYGTQVNGDEFSSDMIGNWVRRRQVPEVYGGHKILEATIIQPFRVTILTLTDFDRSILEDLSILKPTIQGPNVKVPKKLRTKLYYEILKQKVPKVTLDGLKRAGAKGNQLKRRK